MVRIRRGRGDRGSFPEEDIRIRRAMGCSVQVGYFLVRSCNEPAFGACAKCLRQICRSHSRPRGDGEALCVECFAAAAPSRPADESGLSDSSSAGYSSSSRSPSSSSASPASYEAKGGQFGGGGSSSGWIPAAPLGGSEGLPSSGIAPDLSNAADALARQGFSPEDIAAFDQVTAGEDKENPDVYDS